MVTVKGYEIGEQIYEGDFSLVFRGIREADGTAIVLKILKKEFPTRKELEKFKYEYLIAREAQSIAGVIQCFELVKYHQSLAIVMEDIHGVSLNHILQSQKVALNGVLSIAIRLAHIFGELYKKSIIHKDLNPNNIILNPETQEMRVIDFGISTKLTQESQKDVDIYGFEGTLKYISPEQTGRMNRSVDYRTDLYSMGVTFYKMLTGSLPFTSEDPMELIHAHIARKAVPVNEINPTIPQMVSDIVMKLLSKMAEDRYQNAYALKTDLERCYHGLKETGNIPNFQIAKRDFSDKFQIKEKLYGREDEVQRLFNEFTKVMAGETCLVLCAGGPGIGKTFLIHEIHKPLVAERGYFISGKFDQFKRDIPYFAISQAFRELIRQLLTESDEKLAIWKKKFLEALGPNGKIITDIIPELEIIVGKQPDVAESTSTETQNRFNATFQNLLKTITQKDHPLVIFIDDWQWADSATLNLLKLLITDKESQYLMFIGAYRDNEVDATHPFVLALQEIQYERQKGPEVLTLKPLEQTSIHQLVSDALHRPDETILSDLVYSKTHGNPFFTVQFLQSLHSETLLRFNPHQFSWEWDIDQIRHLEVSDNVVDLVLKRLTKLPPQAQQVLYLASCIGNTFQLSMLSTICKRNPVTLINDLLETVKQGFIVPLDDHYKMISVLKEVDHPEACHFKFLHDRVQQAAYSLSDEDKHATHLEIGRLLLANNKNEVIEEIIFEIVGQLNHGTLLITNEWEVIQLSQLNLMAGQKAKQSAAFKSASYFIEVGISILKEFHWQSQHSLMFELHKEWAELEYLNGNHERSEEVVTRTVHYAKSNIEKAEIYLVLMIQYGMVGKFKETLDLGRTILSFFNIEIPLENLGAILQQEVGRIKHEIEERGIETLIDLPVMTDPSMKIAMEIMAAMIGPAYLYNPEFFVMLTTKQTSLALQYGLNSKQAYAIGCFATAVNGIFSDYKLGYEINLFALKLAEKFNDGAQKCRVCNMLQFTVPFVKPIKAVEPYAKAGIQAGVDAGEYQSSGYILYFQGSNMFLGCENLEHVYKEMIPTHLKFCVDKHNLLSVDLYNGLTLIVRNLLGKTPSPTSFDSSQKTESQFMAAWFKNNSQTSIVAYLTFKAMVHYLYKKEKEALKLTLEARELLGFAQGMFLLAFHNCYHSLSLLALYPKSSEANQKLYLNEVTNNQTQMKIWTDSCHENFLHLYLLVEAEKLRVTTGSWEAVTLYDQAIENARHDHFTREEALGNELAGNFCLNHNKKDFALIYFKKAHYCYNQWGAYRKSQELEKIYPKLVFREESSLWFAELAHTKSSISHTPSEKMSEVLDLRTLMKASQAISSEMELKALLQSMMRILIENSGAQTGFLILNKQDQWVIEAKGNPDKDDFEVLQSIPISSHEANIPKSVIHYVVRTKECLVFDNAFEDQQYAHDPYIVEHQVKSLLGLPILQYGKLVAILYLENNLTPGAFTTQRIELLELLSGQIAISIENSKLYTALQDHTAKLQKTFDQLEEKHVALQQTQSQLIQAEKQVHSALGELQKAHAKQNEIIEQERLRIAQDLHDEAQQIFGAVHRDYVQQIAPPFRKTFSEEMGKGQKSIDSAINELYPPALQNLGLVPALEDYITKLNHFKNMEIHFKYITTPNLNKSIRLALFRIVQECLSNVIKHSGTCEVEVIIQQPTPQLLWVQISDEGKGFDVEAPSHRYGLTFMKERARQIGARLEIQSEVGEGTTIICKLPLLH